MSINGVDLYNGSASTFDVFLAAHAMRPFKGDITLLERNIKSPLLALAMQHKRAGAGPNIQGDLVMSNPANAQRITPGAERSYTITQIHDQFQIPWRSWTTYTPVMRQEILGALSSGAAGVVYGNMGEPGQKVFDLLETMRAAIGQDFGEYLEDDLLDAPPNSTDTEHCHGAWAWVAKATANQESAGQVGGWYGYQPQYGDNTQMASCANITYVDGTETERWANYTDVWADDGSPMTEADVSKIIWTKRKLGYTPPMTAQEFNVGRNAEKTLLAGQTIVQALEEKARANNDNLGADLGKFAGSVVVQGSMVHWVPGMDGDTDNPLLFLDFQHLFFVYRAGELFLQTPWREMPFRPDVFVQDTDLTGNFVCNDRRALGVISKSVTPS